MGACGAFFAIGCGLGEDFFAAVDPLSLFKIKAVALGLVDFSSALLRPEVLLLFDFFSLPLLTLFF